MIFLLDQGLPRSAVSHLAVLGITAQHVSERGLADAADDVILAEAKSLDAILVTLDADLSRTSCQLRCC